MSRSVVLIECHELYNYLQYRDAHALHRMQNYLLLLDCRERREYDESHIVTAQHINVEDTNATISAPFGADMGCRDHVVVYDSATVRLDEVSRAVVCAQSIAADSSRNPIKILKGGYEAFTAYYPFLRSKKVFHMPREFDSIKLYPIEVLSPLLLYLGDQQQGTDEVLHKDLHIRVLIKCYDDGKPGESRMSRRSILSYVSQSETADPNAKPAEYCFELPDDEQVSDLCPRRQDALPKELQQEQEPEAEAEAEAEAEQEQEQELQAEHEQQPSNPEPHEEDAQVHFVNEGTVVSTEVAEETENKLALRDQLFQAVQIIEACERKKEAVLVYSKRGNSRAVAVVLAYLMQRSGITLREACRYLQQRTNRVRPNRKLLEGLSDVEEVVRGSRATNIDNICF